MAELKVADAAGCCATCSAKEGCASWVYRSDRPSGDNCWLKSSNSKTAKGAACTSAGSGPIKCVVPQSSESRSCMLAC